MADYLSAHRVGACAHARPREARMRQKTQLRRVFGLTQRDVLTGLSLREHEDVRRVMSSFEAVQYASPTRLGL